jgi:hypothetical protein
MPTSSASRERSGGVHPATAVACGEGEEFTAFVEPSLRGLRAILVAALSLADARRF